MTTENDKHKKFMAIARDVSLFSKDPSTKVGALLINKTDNRFVSSGYNGFIKGCNEQLMTFERPMKYFLTIHAELNCILFAKVPLDNTILYVTHSPCTNCLKHILQCGIRVVYYDILYNKYEHIELEAIKLLIKSVSEELIIKNINSGLDYISELFSEDNTV